MKRAEKRVPRWLKDGSVDASKFRVIRAEPYMLHQRVAAQGRKGRVLLAGDALHVSPAHCEEQKAPWRDMEADRNGFIISQTIQWVVWA